MSSRPSPFSEPSPAQRVVITGGTGFIGQAVAAALVARDVDVTLLDLPDRIGRVAPGLRARVIAGDVGERSAYDRLDAAGNYDAVIHLAAQTSNRVSHEEPERDVNTNARGTLLITEWCCARGISRLLYSSSMAVYGHPEKLPIQEKDRTLPFSYYGITKLAGEHYIRANRGRGLNATIFRLFNVYGPGQDLANLKQGMASIYLAYVLRGLKVPVTGSLDRYRDFVYIDDVVAAFLRVLDEPKAYGRIFNVGSGTSTTVRDLLQVIVASAGEDPARYPVEQVESHAGDQFGMVADASLLRDELGWHPTVPLPEGIRRMVTWARPTLAAGVGGSPR
jgi:UDP-glucose 4-epimerase